MAEDADENEDSNPKIPGDANKDKIYDKITDEIGTITKRMSNIMLASPASSSCAFKSCVQEQNENDYMLECSKCKQRTHYYCTQLPDYQIALFLQKVLSFVQMQSLCWRNPRRHPQQLLCGKAKARE